MAERVRVREIDHDEGSRPTAAVRQRCRSEHVEPPTEGQLERVVASAAHRFEEAFAVGVTAVWGVVADCGGLAGAGDEDVPV
ncbi:hypothetical protein [Actinomadura sp. NPDC049753]|uniref:hypothetical protein n=1 Tax=Actinomadura sp. NPDC049753 TaxID=3154739 RepID=UPI003449AB6F